MSKKHTLKAPEEHSERVRKALVELAEAFRAADIRTPPKVLIERRAKLFFVHLEELPDSFGGTEVLTEHEHMNRQTRLRQSGVYRED
jgi:hypothetical protein